MKREETVPKAQRIRDAAEEVFSMYGYEKATLDQIISLADVGKGTVYKYFGNKGKLFYDLVLERNISFVKILQEAVASKQDIKNQLLAYFTAMIKFYRQNRNLWQIIYFEMLGASNNCRVELVNGEYQVVPRYRQLVISDEIKERILRYHELIRSEYVILENIVAKAINDGLLKGSSDIEISSKYLFFSVTVSIFNPTQMVKDQMPANEVAKIIIDRFLYGESIIGKI